ncbi:TonB-dependent siderophore receptor [Lautropia dentalis]|uniref:TonB-dependent siderophore receptor n=1 Tax=Lautropia dentalis TaxID=2490857 RepID=A0A3R8LST1_9BURK|nr:TonB-dependent siderophore receptor [Lautropia dentalis]RRN45394.1 TonB-dependent siderophore receptor [Lautropia dentalis]
MKPKHFSLRPLVVSLGACGILFSGSGIHAQEVSDDGAIRATSDDGAIRATGDDGAIRATGDDGSSGSGLKVKAATLPEINVTDRSRDVNQVSGYVPTNSSAGTRTETPINEIPRSISVIGAQQIQDQNSRSLSEAMRYMPGVSSGNFGEDPLGDWIQMRGFGTRAFQDGIPDITDTSEKGDVRDEPFLYERMEVLRGPSSALSGHNSPGGIIHLVSKRPQATKFGELNVSYGTYDTKLMSLDSTGPLDKDGQWLYRVIALGSKGGAQVHHAKSERAVFKPMLTWVPTARTNITVFAEYQRDYNNTVQGYLPRLGTLQNRAIGKISPRLFVSEPDFDRARGIRKRAGWEVNQQLSDNWSMRHHLRFAKNERILNTMYPNYSLMDEVWVNEDGEVDIENGQYMQRTFSHESGRRNSLTGDLLFQGHFNTGSMKHNALIGFDMNNIHGTTRSMEAEATPLNAYDPVYGGYELPDLSEIDPQTKKFKAYGITLQDQVKLTDALSITGALRYDRVEQRLTSPGQEKNAVTKQNDHKVSPNIGVVWDVGGGVSPYINYAESFEAQYGTRLADGGLAKPTVGKQVEGGVKWLSPDKRILLTGGVFNINQKNGVLDDPNNPGYSIQNGKIKSRGIELESAFNLRTVNLIAQYTYNRAYNAVVDEATANSLKAQLQTIPKHTAAISATYRFSDFGLPNLRVGAGVIYKGEMGDGSNDGVKVPSVVTGDLMASYEVNNVTFALNANNVSDKKYVAYCSSGGDCGWGSRRRITGTITYRW